MLRRFLQDSYKVIVEHRLDESGRKRIDFYLPDYNICIELDGEQHFKDQQIGSARIPCSLESDKVKQSAIFANDFSLVRIYQPYLWALRAKRKFWHQLVTSLIKLAYDNDKSLVLPVKYKHCSLGGRSQCASALIRRAYAP